MAINQYTNQKKRPKPSFYKRQGFWWTILLLLLATAAGGVFGLHFFQEYTEPYRERANSYDLERINKLEVPSLIMDRKGKEIGRFFVQNRSVIQIDQVSEVFIDALRAGEDQRFETHDGVDYIGVLRAVYLNWKAGETTQGASTITQQLARNAYDLEGERRLKGETSMQRKIVEAFLAHRIERQYEKREILEFYLNRIYFGSGYYGIRSASLGYFGKEPIDLTALESAAIVGCIKNPSNLSPLNNPKGNQKSRNLVLGRMVDLGALTSSEAAELQETSLVLNPRPLRRGTSHLYERVAEAVSRVMGDDGLAAGGYKIHTTILADAQFAAEKALEQSLLRAEARADYNQPKHRDFKRDSSEAPAYVQGACLMVDQETGEVLVHVGGRDYAQSPYDFIEAGKRPLGTAFFPFMYAAALEQGLTPSMSLDDEAMDNRSVMVGGREGILGEWGMEVPSPVYEGKITMRKALEQSKIAASVRLIDEIGLKNVVDRSCKFGLPLENAELLRRIAVGFEEVSLKQAVRAMSVFPHGGKLGSDELVYLDSIEDANGHPVYQRKPKERETQQIIQPATAWQVHDMMSGSLKHGSSRGVLDGMVEKPFFGAGKGGSTHDFSDSWFVGYNQRVTCGVWTGFLNAGDQTMYPGAFSRDLAMPVWQAAMNAAAAKFPSVEMKPPPDIVMVPVCSKSGQRATQFCQEYAEAPGSTVVNSHSTVIDEYFRKTTEQLAFCNLHTGSHTGDGSYDATQLDLPALDAVPVKPKSPVLLGDDPYHSDVSAFTTAASKAVIVNRRANVLDSLDLSDKEETLKLPRPPRLDIGDE